MVLRNILSKRFPITSRVLKVSVFGTFIFLLCIKGIYEEVQSPIFKFVDDVEVLSSVTLANDNQILRKNPDGLNQ